MFPISSDLYVFLLTGLSGLVAIEVFYYFKDKPKKFGEFEFFGLSLFWGLLILLFQLVVLKDKPTAIISLANNPFAAGIVLPFWGIIGGWLVAVMTNTRLFGKIISFLRGSFRK